jgi:hypothetical protein
MVFIRYDVITAALVRTPGVWDMTSCGFLCALAASTFRVVPAPKMDADLISQEDCILDPSSTLKTGTYISSETCVPVYQCTQDIRRLDSFILEYPDDVSKQLFQNFVLYSSIKSTKSPASGASNVCEPRLTSWKSERRSVCFCRQRGGGTGILVASFMSLR